MPFEKPLSWLMLLAVWGMYIMFVLARGLVSIEAFGAFLMAATSTLMLLNERFDLKLVPRVRAQLDAQRERQTARAGAATVAAQREPAVAEKPKRATRIAEPEASADAAAGEDTDDWLAEFDRLEASIRNRK